MTSTTSKGSQGLMATRRGGHKRKATQSARGRIMHHTLRPKHRRHKRVHPSPCKGSEGNVFTGPLAWKGDELKPEMYVHFLTPEEIQECLAAVAEFKASKQHLGYISQETFRLPRLGPVLRQRSRELHNLNGLLILRGLIPPKAPDEVLILQGGISSWIGSKRGVQVGNAADPDERYVALHVTDHDLEKIREAEPDRFVASANTTVSMPFHTDSGDVISLFYRTLSQTGGEIRIAPSLSVYNEILEKNPEMIETLKQPFPWDMIGNIPDRAYHGLIHETFDSCGTRQLMLMSEQRPFYGDEKCPRNKDLPELTTEQKEALAMIQKVASKVCTSISLEVGDILFINNRAMLHARSSYVDLSRDPAEKRHVIRLVLRDAEYGWPIPEPLAHRYHNMFGTTERPEDERWGVGAFIWGTGAQHG